MYNTLSPRFQTWMLNAEIFIFKLNFRAKDLKSKILFLFVKSVMLEFYWNPVTCFIWEKIILILSRSSDHKSSLMIKPIWHWYG